MSNPLNVLLIEDNEEHAAIIARHLRQVEAARIVVSHVSRLADGLAQLTTHRFDALLLDLQLPDSPIEHTLRRTLSHALDLPIIVISTIEERSLAKQALKEGAQDYLCKVDLSSELLGRTIENAIERKRTELHRREETFRKEALFHLSQHALSEKKVSSLLDKTASTVAQALRVDFVKIMEFLPEEHAFLLRAGLGWKDHLVGRQKVGLELNAMTGFTFRASRPTIPGNLKTLEPVLIEDLTTETRFAPADFVREHGIRSGISVVIHGKDQERPYGVLAALSDRKRKFNVDEAQFLQAAANVLAAALLRIQLEDDLERRVADRTNELEQSQGRLRALATELNLAEHRERKRLATVLHDHLAQMLVLGRLKLGQAKRLPSLDSRCADLLQQTDETLSQSLTYTRTLVANLSPSVLYEFGLCAAIRWLAEQIQQYDLTVQLDIPAQLPIPLAEEQAVLIFQSVRELLMNCAKHSKSSHAKVLLESQEGILRVEVRDVGVGFNVAALTGSGSAPKFGLFSIRERMRALGGSLGLHSKPGEGTIAILTLPIQCESGEPTPASEGTTLHGDDSLQPAEPFQSNYNKSLKVHVLLVDDHAMIRQGLRSVLETYADIHVVGEACDGAEAVDLVERLCPRVVVMDINMPKMNGIEATSRIKTIHPEMVVIGLSVNASNDNQTAMRLAGASVLLTKEAAVEQLYQSIHDAIRDCKA